MCESHCCYTLSVFPDCQQLSSVVGIFIPLYQIRNEVLGREGAQFIRCLHYEWESDLQNLCKVISSMVTGRWEIP